uniref:Thiamin pyrophosphokinase catalytic domain-containing protein n=1 Tax=Globodera rostochiensis TaxID=31243 RepID=A0A914I607_GLORO
MGEISAAAGRHTFAPFRLIRQHFDELAVILTNSPPSVVARGDVPFPPDWIRIWNSAKIRLCTDGAANRLVGLCSDGHLKVPELVVGDFDSITAETQQYFSQFPTCELRQVADQDSTDLSKALSALMERTCKLSGILLLGGFHGRIDHVLGALHVLLLHIQQVPQVPLFAMDDENVLTVLPEVVPD